MKLWIEQTMHVTSAWLLTIPWAILACGAIAIGVVK